MNNQAMIISKVKHIYIMLLHSISKENISIVDHYLDDSLTQTIKKNIENNIKNNVKQVYRLPNISNLSIIQEDNEHITFNSTVKYIKYLVDRKTNKYVSGDNKNRVTKIAILKFRKNNLNSKILFNCPSCGAGLNINKTSICPYCDASLDERYSPYVLCSITYK